MTQIFGYGSLIWKADFPFETRRMGYIQGGVPNNPGRVATLVSLQDWQSNFQHIDPHGATVDDRVWGCVYTIRPEDKHKVFEYLDYREKNGYRLELVRVHFDSQETTDCYVYVAPITDVDFLGPCPSGQLERIAHQIKGAHGPSGSNVEYLTQLVEALQEKADTHLLELHTLINN
ncbi:Cation transport regulator-like protein 2 [Kappamyces sp. JEL0829]|nr:Cation transport regulator-like protein 2 [Kappamyces sp. JEL0829]